LTVSHLIFARRQAFIRSVLLLVTIDFVLLVTIALILGFYLSISLLSCLVCIITAFILDKLGLAILRRVKTVVIPPCPYLVHPC